MAVCFIDGFIHLMKSYDDAFPKIIETNLEGKFMHGLCGRCGEGKIGRARWRLAIGDCALNSK